MNILDIVAVVSLSLLGISFLIFVISVIPVLVQLQRLFLTLQQIADNIKTDVMPEVKQFSSIFGDAGRVAEQGKNIGSKLVQSVKLLSQGIKTGLDSYFKNK